MAHLTKRLSFVLLLTIALTGCATRGALRLGEQAELAQDYDRAVLEYTRALQAAPDNRSARQGLERAKLRAALDHFTRGRRLEAAGRLDDALQELQLAAELNPGDPNVGEMLEDVRTKLRDKIAVSRAGKTELEALIERSQTFQPEGFELPTDVRLPPSLTFVNASSRDVYSAIAKLTNISMAFDPQFRDQPITVDLRNSTLENALATVSNMTRNFFRVTGQRTVTIVPDTPAKRTEYEELIVRTFFLSNADAKETMDMLRVVADLRRIGPASGINAISVNDTPERVAAAGRLIAAIDKARPEVVIDVELLEFDRTRLREYGLQLASSGSAGINGLADINREGLTVSDLRNISLSDVFLTNLPGVFYRLLKSDSNTRTLANTQLRASEGMRAQARFGEQVPVPVTVFSPIATGGLAQQPVTSFNYKDIGVNIDITPRTHHDDEVSLALEIVISSISGTGFGNLPTFGNRSINTVIRLRDGETNLLAGLIRDDERRVASGIPGLSDIPMIGRLFAHNRRETQETDIVLTLTPHIVRRAEFTEEDLRPFRVGRGAGAGSSPLLELPIIIDQPDNAPPPVVPQTPPAQQQQPPQALPPVVLPIQPPAPAAPIQPTPQQ